MWRSRYALVGPIVGLALPIMLQGVLFSLMGFVDSLMIGQLGELAISAQGNVGQLLSFSFLLFAALTTGGSILISQFSGAQQERKVEQIAHTMIVAGGGCGLLLGGIFYVLAKPLVALLTTDLFLPVEQWSQVPEVASGYLHIVAFAVPAMLLSQVIAAVFNATGDTKTPVKVSVAFNIVNFIGNYVLIFGLDLPGSTGPMFTPLGLLGAAFATLIASLGQALVLFVMIYRRLGGFKWGQWSELKQIIQLGYPNSIDGFYWQGARVFYTVLMNSIGAIAYAGYAIVRTFKGLFMLPVGGLQQATGIYIGKLLGAGELEQAKITARAAIWAGVILMSIPVTLLVLLAHPLLGLYQIQAETYQQAYWCLWILAGSLFFTAVNSVIPGILRAGGDTKSVMNITLKSFAFMGAPASLLLGVGFDLGLIGAFIGISLEEIFKSYLFIRQLQKDDWLNNLAERSKTQVAAG
ncbi:MATE family efflux transporter [Vibrio bivalvicida]|uniref:Multidrug resistance protein NorM n=1 Tax=Vibrio bivalvicida TaxID=1276888 RepID=A0A177XX69_9VIBR|nr:MATE family efflux transporter [Vibrio bivalvicida]OAJ93202.1 MATE family efflux transporter [Vibrio bivalvicida]